MADTPFVSLATTNIIAATDQILLVRGGVPYAFNGTLPKIAANGNVEFLHSLTVTGAAGLTALTVSVASANNETPDIKQVIVTNGSDNVYRKVAFDYFMASITAAGFQTPNTGSTGGIRLKGNAESGYAYLQILNSTAFSQWGVLRWNAAGQMYYSGDIVAQGTVTQLSDAAVKKDVRVIDDALNKVKTMRGVYFTFIDTDKLSSGVIAQELEAVAPELVSTDEDGIRSVAYGNAIGYLIEAIKQLSFEKDAEIDALRADIAALKS